MRLTAPATFFVAALGRRVPAGETVDVDPQLGASLAAQGWKPAKPATTKPTKGTNTSEED